MPKCFTPSARGLVRAGTALAALSIATATLAQVDFDESGEELSLAGSFGDTRVIRFADMDGDDDLDVLVGAWSSSLRVWLNDGTGAYTDSGFNEVGDAHFVNWLVPEDFDGDGDNDVLAVRAGGQPSTLWFNDGSGGLTLSDQTFPSGSHADAGDLDDDGDMDAVFDGGEVYLNDGSGQLTQLTNLGAGGAVGIGDLDGDSDADMLFASATMGNVYFNDGAAPPDFGSPVSVPVPGLRSAELVDLDNDGDADALTHSGVYLNDGSGNFTESRTWSGDVMEATAADADLDGDPDVALALRGPSFTDIPNEIRVNDGNASFTDPGLELGSNVGNSVAFDDFDGDGDPDLIFGTSGSDYVIQHENTGGPYVLFRDRFEN